MNGRAGRPLGVIYGNVGSVDFSFAVTGPARKLDYVQVHHGEHGWLLGQIVDLFRETRLSYDGASLLSAEESGKEVRGRLSARVHLFGYRDEGGHMEAPLTPLNAGQTVYRADDGFIGMALGLGASGASGGASGRTSGGASEAARDRPSGVYIGVWEGALKNYAPNMGYDYGGRLQAAWLDR